MTTILTPRGNKKPSAGDMGIEDAYLILLKSPEKSVLLARMKDEGTERMPPIASKFIDQKAVDVVEQWISSLAKCYD